MVCSLHSVTTGSRDRANVSLIIIHLALAAEFTLTTGENRVIPFILDVRFVGVPARVTRRYFQHAHFIPIVGVGKRGEY